MDKIRVVFFFTLLAIVIAIARYNSPAKRSSEQPVSTLAPAASPAATAVAVAETTPSPAATSAPIVEQTPKAQPTATPSGAFVKVAPKVAPAVAVISVFDETGKLLRSGTGCFVSRDGRLVTSSSIIRGAAHGVARVSDGRIINISGILADSEPLDVAVLKVETQKGVAYIAPNKSASTATGVRIAAVGSPLVRQQPGYFEGTIPGRGSDQAGDWIETGITVPKECIGAPLVNEKGELIGIVTSQRPQGASNEAARKADAIETLIAGINPNATAAWLVAESPNGPLPPGEGPSVTPTPTPSRFAKIPVVQADRPGHTRLISSPKPAYPTAARHSYFPVKGDGRYRVKFNANGQVTDVAVLQSTRNETLDNAAVDALRRWKAAPGQEWTATVPVSFQP